MSVSSAGVQGTAGGSIAPSLSGDGRYVAFDSAATNLVTGDTNGKRDVFVRDRTTGQTTRISVHTSGAEGNGDSVSANITPDGRYVAFLSKASNLVAGDTNGLADVFVRDRQTGQTERVNIGVGGVQANSPTWPGEFGWYEDAEMANFQVALSADGRYVAFVSWATTLYVANASLIHTGVCVRDRQAGSTGCIRVPVPAGGLGDLGEENTALSMSSDGRFVAFATGSALLASDTNRSRDVYVHDRTTNQTTLVSVSTAGVIGNEASGWPAISASGRYVAFASDASNLIAGSNGGQRFIHVHDRENGTTRRIGGVRALHPSMSADGRFVAYEAIYYGSAAIYLFDTQTSVSRVITTGAPNGTSFGAAVSPDGLTVAFGSAASNLVAGDTNGQDDVFVTGQLCGYSVTRGVTSFSAAGGTGTLTIDTQPGCDWSLSADSSWISPASTQGNGAAMFVFRVAPNATSSARQASITVGTDVVRISQTTKPPVHGDLDGNGTADLLWQHADGRLAAWLMSGTTLLDGRPLGPGALMDPAWRIAASGDFDRDGSPDVVFQHQTDGRLALWLMSGTTELAGVAFSPGQVVDTNWKIRGAGDIDRDGWIDLIWQHQTNGQLAVWFMTGTSLRDGRLLTPGSVADLNWRIVGLGDMNGDGNVDLIWQHQISGLISAWLMNGSTLMSGALLTPGQVSDTNWKIRAVTDINGDGRPDLVWQHQGTGLLSAWLMSGLALSGDGLRFTPNLVADTGWQIVGPK